MSVDLPCVSSTDGVVPVGIFKVYKRESMRQLHGADRMSAHLLIWEEPNMKWDEAKDLVHDASGISDPHRWEWEQQDGIMQPVKRIPVIAEADPRVRMRELEEDVLLKLTLIHDLIKSNGREFIAKGGNNWGYVGSMAYVSGELDNILEHITNK